MKTKTFILAAIICMAFPDLKSQILTSYPPSGSGQATSSQGQNTTSGFISIGGGLSEALGQFASTSNSSSSGYAVGGYDAYLSFALPIARSNFGIAVKSDVFADVVNANSINQANINSMNQSLSADGFNNPSSSVSGAYAGLTGLGGLYVTLPLHHLSFDFRALAGILYIATPKQSVEDYDGSDNIITITQSVSPVMAFAYDGGLDVRYNTGHFCVGINFDYLAANPSFNYSENETDDFSASGNGIKTYSSSTKQAQPVSMLNLSVSFGYKF